MKGSTILGYWSPNVPVRTGRDDVQATLVAPALRGLQDERTCRAGEPLPIAPGKGVILVIK